MFRKFVPVIKFLFYCIFSILVCSTSRFGFVRWIISLGFHRVEIFIMNCVCTCICVHNAVFFGGGVIIISPAAICVCARVKFNINRVSYSEIPYKWIHSSRRLYFAVIVFPLRAHDSIIENIYISRNRFHLSRYILELYLSFSVI